MVAVVAAGGAVGALLRYGAGRLWRNGSDAHAVWRTGEAAFPWTPLVVNVVGCFLMGALIVALKERFTHAPRLLNPFWAPVSWVASPRSRPTRTTPAGCWRTASRPPPSATWS